MVNICMLFFPEGKSEPDFSPGVRMYVPGLVPRVKTGVLLLEQVCFLPHYSQEKQTGNDPSVQESGKGYANYPLVS